MLVAQNHLILGNKKGSINSGMIVNHLWQLENDMFPGLIPEVVALWDTVLASYFIFKMTSFFKYQLNVYAQLKHIPSGIFPIALQSQCLIEGTRNCSPHFLQGSTGKGS